MISLELPDGLVDRIVALRDAQRANIHDIPPEAAADPTTGHTSVEPDPTEADVVAAAINLLELHWVADPGAPRAFAGDLFQKLYSDVPADPLLRQRAAKEFELSEPFVYTGARFKDDPDLPSWVVARTPESTDFASIPGFLTWLVPRYGRHTMAALVHDHLQDLLVADSETEREKQGQRAVTSTQADYIMREAMRSSGVPFVQRWIMWAAISMRTLVLKPFNLYRLLVTILVVLAYGLGAGVIGLGWALTAPIIRLSGGEPWTVQPWVVVLVLLSPFVTGLLWLPRYRTGVIAPYAVMLVAMPTLFITLARLVYWAAEWLGKVLRPQHKEVVGGTVVTFAHNPIFEANWEKERGTRADSVEDLRRAGGDGGGEIADQPVPVG